MPSLGSAAADAVGRIFATEYYHTTCSDGSYYVVLGDKILTPKVYPDIMAEILIPGSLEHRRVCVLLREGTVDMSAPDKPSLKSV